jgi:alpha-L-arabinofuranosidase
MKQTISRRFGSAVKIYNSRGGHGLEFLLSAEFRFGIVVDDHFYNHVGDQIVNASVDGSPLRFLYSVTRDSKTGKVHLKLVNATTSPRTLAIRLNGISKVGKNAKIISLSAKTLESTNTISEPKKIVRKESKIVNVAPQFSHTLAPNSIEVVELETQ